MLTRNNREPQEPVPAPRGSRPQTGSLETRRPRMRWTMLVVLIALMLAALTAPTGQAQGASEGSSEAAESAVATTEATVNVKQSAREERAAAKQAQREARQEAKRERQEAKRAARSERSSSRQVQNSSRERAHGGVHFACTGVSWHLTNFPAGANSVQALIRLYPEGGGTQPTTITATFAFNGSAYETTTPLQAPPGEYKIDAWAKWNGNGLKGSFDILGRLVCSPAPELSVVNPHPRRSKANWAIRSTTRSSSATRATCR
jgi:hypothetical protein